MADHEDSKAFQQFLDNQQYTKTNILRYEKIFGRTFISTGGLQTTEELTRLLELKPQQYVLDVGCGIGGSAFYMDEQYGAVTRGVDLSENMIELAEERRIEKDSKNVTFHIEDIMTATYESATFDVIYSRDTLLHIEDKPTLFQNFLKWLKPGGKLLVTDYSCSEGEHPEHFEKYVEQRGYHLYTPMAYQKLMDSTGFVNIDVQDRTTQYVNILKRERGEAEDIKEEFIKEFSQNDYDKIISGWAAKIDRATEGCQRWCMLYGEKAGRSSS